MKGVGSLSEPQIGKPQVERQKAKGWSNGWEGVGLAVCAIALAISIALWFLAVRAPLDLDESGSYWQICAGVAKIWQRQFLFPSCLAYSYMLWLWTRFFGIGEIALRVPSVMAMLGAAYLMYRNARQILGREGAFFATVVFCIHPAIRFASIDVRPYAFAMLAVNAAIYILIRLRKNNSYWLAALFGLSAAIVIWFQFLYAVIAMLLAVCFFAFKTDRRAAWRQLAVALAAFAVAILPTLPGALFLLRTRSIHVFDTAPTPEGLLLALAPGWMLPMFVCFAPMGALASAFSKRRHDTPRAITWQVLFCVLLGVAPVLILYGISLGTPIHIFAPRYCLMAVPGIALCWALLLERFRSRAMRVLFCASVVAVSGWTCLRTPYYKQHDIPWKNALQLVESKAAAYDSPVLVCSGFIESDHLSMPLDSANASPLFAPLSYQPLSVPVVPLPRDLNDEARKVIELFLRGANEKHQRFLVLGHLESFATLSWIEQQASATYTSRSLGVPDGFRVVEFAPRDHQAAQDTQGHYLNKADNTE